MEFWSIEVKSGQPHKVEPGNGMVLHLSQACLVEAKKKQDNEIVRLYVKNGDQKIVLGNLSLEKFPQVSFDLVFGDEFELSHDWKHGSIHFAGYKAVTPEEEREGESDEDSDLGEPVPVQALNNGTLESKKAKLASKPKAVEKPETGAAKPKVNFAEPSKTEESSDDSEDDEDEDSEEDAEGDSDEEMSNAEDDDSDEEDSDEDEDESDEETPKKVEPSKKRAADSASKTPPMNKKSKLATPQKTDGKKVSQHVATPHPAKQAGKTPANSEKLKQQTPKSGGSLTCDSCPRSFGSEKARPSHSKAKHGAK